jgi:drug/metabolite transporter (DMT)-like permease
VGAALALVSVSNDAEVTLLGDLAAFAGAIAIVGYLSAGRELRSWMPLFIYAFPVTLIAGIFLTLSSMMLEGTGFDEISSMSTFGWTDLVWLPAVAYLALGPGLIGHTGINGVLKWLPPIVISVSVLIEPILGTFIGILIGTADYPDYWTLIGGSIIMIGLYLVITAEESEQFDDTEE